MALVIVAAVLVLIAFVVFTLWADAWQLGYWIRRTLHIGRR